MGRFWSIYSGSCKAEIKLLTQLGYCLETLGKMNWGLGDCFSNPCSCEIEVLISMLIISMCLVFALKNCPCPFSWPDPSSNLQWHTIPSFASNFFHFLLYYQPGKSSILANWWETFSYWPGKRKESCYVYREDWMAENTDTLKESWRKS
jgi:hypothetical protein